MIISRQKARPAFLSDQFLISLLNFFESAFGQILELLSQVGDLIGVVLIGQFAVGRLDGLLIRVGWQIQYLIGRPGRIWIPSGTGTLGCPGLLSILIGIEGTGRIAGIWFDFCEITIKQDKDDDIVQPTQSMKTGYQIIGREQVDQGQYDQEPFHFHFTASDFPLCGADQ